MNERKKEDLSVQDVEVVPVKKKRKKISISMIFCVVFLITTGIFWSNSEENSKSYAAVQKQYDELKLKYGSVEKQFNEQKDEIETLKSENSEQQDQIESLEDKNSDLKEQVNTLKSEKKKLKTENASLKTKVENASSTSSSTNNSSSSSSNNGSHGGMPASSYSSDSSSDSEETMVWLSETGEKYHSKPNCGRMNPDKARQVTESDAESMGYGRCHNCFK